MKELKWVEMKVALMVDHLADTRDDCLVEMKVALMVY